MTLQEIIEMWQATSRKPNHIEEFARLVAAKYENKIQELEDMITEIQERQE